jgi:hypothetical protein
MKHPQNLLDPTKQCGNTQLITDNRANIIFETDYNLVLAKEIMQKKKDELLTPKSTQQISPLEKFEIDGVMTGEWKAKQKDDKLILSNFKLSNEKKKEIKNDAKSQTTIGDYK